MCCNVHMRKVTIRELHINTGKWVRHAAEVGGVIVTDRGREVAALQPVGAVRSAGRLPNREALIQRMSRIEVDGLSNKRGQATAKLPQSVHLRTGDAVHLACAQQNGFEAVYSNDRHLLAAAPHFDLRGVNLLA